MWRTMMEKIKRLLLRRRSLLIVVSAALLLELLSAAQYYLTHDLMEEQLEKRAEGELRMKAFLIKSTLNSTEALLRDFSWKFQAHLDQPDSALITVTRMASLEPHLRGVSVFFRPHFYPQKGAWYEPYARRDADGVVETLDIGGAAHDWFGDEVFKAKVEAGAGGFWEDPYVDDDGAQDMVTSYFLPFNDRKGQVAGVAGADVSIAWLSDTINARHLFPSSYVMLLTEDGKPIVKPDEEHTDALEANHVVDLINDSTVERTLSATGRCDFITFKANGRSARVFFANMKGQPHWQLAVVCYDDEVFEPLIRLRLQLLLLMLLAFAVLLGLVFAFRRKDEKLRKQTQEQEYINKELQVASNIQQALLPDGGEELGSDSVKVVGRLIPAKQVGGDLYNAFIRDGKLFFCIGDVTGKGVPAALIMAITQTLFRNVAARESNPTRIMGELNQAACRNNTSNIFITLFVGVLDLPTGHLRYCNAGHEVPILLTRSKSRLLEVKANLPVGIFADFGYEAQELDMNRGDTLLFYTDGLTEAKNAEKQLLGREHVAELAASGETTDAKELVESVIARWRAFVGDAEQSDDMTLLAVSYTPQEVHNILDETLTLSNDVKEVATLSTFIKDVTARLGIDKSLAAKLRLALEEAVVNVMEYAYPAGSHGTVNIRVTSDGRQLKFIITDNGISFDPTEASKADTTLSAEERPVGGLGILLVRKLMDTINYERIGKQNVLTMKKELAAAIIN